MAKKEDAWYNNRRAAAQARARRPDAEIRKDLREQLEAMHLRWEFWKRRVPCQ